MSFYSIVLPMTGIKFRLLLLFNAEGILRYEKCLSTNIMETSIGMLPTLTPKILDKSINSVDKS